MTFDDKALSALEFGLEMTLGSINRIVEIFVDRVRQSIVMPYCEERNYTFLSGMGTYFFTDSSGEAVETDHGADTDEETKRIFKVLDAEIVGRFTVGEYMNDIKLEDVKEYRDAKN